MERPSHHCWTERKSGRVFNAHVVDPHPDKSGHGASDMLGPPGPYNGSLPASASPCSMAVGALSAGAASAGAASSSPSRAVAAALAVPSSPGQDMRCTLTTGGGAPDTRPSPLVTTGMSPASDRDRRVLPPRRRPFEDAADVDDSTAFTLEPPLRLRAALSAFNVAARAASSAGSMSCTSAKR